MLYRTGFGMDIHRLKKGRPFILGGIKIPHSKGPVAHSDGDVLIHSICDALLGAANMSDIGTHFPDTSSKYKNIDSKILLQRVAALLRKNKYSVVNIDSTVCLEKPKISPFIGKMKQKLSEVIGIGKDRMSIKATTSEKLGFIGKEQGVAAYAVALLKKNLKNS